MHQRVLPQPFGFQDITPAIVKSLSDGELSDALTFAWRKHDYYRTYHSGRHYLQFNLNGWKQAGDLLWAEESKRMEVRRANHRHQTYFYGYTVRLIKGTNQRLAERMAANTVRIQYAEMGMGL